MKVASLDLGSNSFLCLIAEVDEYSVSHIYRDESRVVRLSEGVAVSGNISSAALQRAKEALLDFKNIIKSENVNRVIAVTTAVARQASNAHSFFELLNGLNIPIQLLTGDQEADITYTGACSGLINKDHVVVIDIGGGSTEIIYGNQNIKMKSKSFNFGVVGIKEKFQIKFPFDINQVKQISNYIDHEISDYIQSFSINQINSVIAVAGTPTTLASMEIGKYIPERVDGYLFTYESLLSWFDTLSLLTPQQIIKTYAIDSGRADVIAIGVLILTRILKKLNFFHLRVSVRGVRYGVALQYAKGELKNV